MTLRILIVEDDKHTRRILESLLAHDPSLAARDLQVVAAQDGRQGMEALETGAFDLIVSDLLMPKMDGFQFCRELRKHPHGKVVPLIVTSAIYKDPVTIQRLQAETGAHFFAKPFQLPELMTAVRRLLGPGDGQPPGTPSPKTRAPASLRSVETVGTATSAVGRSQSGSLARRPPARILLDLVEQSATGRLTFQRAKIAKQLTLLHGTPVHVQSNLRTETLGHFLLSCGLLDEAQHQEALSRAQSSQDRLGQVLIELGWITEQELLKQLSAQMRMKIANLLRWKDGDWSFTPEEPPRDRMQIPIDAARTVFDGLQKTAHVDDIAQLLAPIRGHVSLTLLAEKHRDAFVRTFGAAGLEALARRPLLEELMAGADPAAMLIQLDALLACGMAEIEPDSQPMSSDEKRDPLALQHILGAPERVDAPPTPTHKLYDDLFGDENSPTKSPELPASEDSARRDEPGDVESGVMQLPTTRASAPVAASKAVDPAVEALRKEVLNQYLAIHDKDYFQVLGVGQDARPEAIAAAYAALGKRFELERFAEVDLGRDYAHLEQILQMFRDAFETLSSPTARDQYLRRIQLAKRPARPLLDAELLAQESATLLAAGDATGAQAKLREAVAVAPEQADFHALLAWTTFVSESGGPAPTPERAQAAARAAWNELDLAFAIDADHIDAHDFAGRIAAILGNDARAVRHLERVLDADPRRVEALAALEECYARQSDWKHLERQYRKLIHRFGDAEPERVLGLWWRLAELYHHHLQYRESARVAYEIAAKLAPEDPRPREALASLHAEDPDAWAQAALALRDSWRLAPEDPLPGSTLYQLHIHGERWDAAYAAAAALGCRGANDGDAAGFLRSHRPRFLMRAQCTMTPELLQDLRHPDDDAALSALFGLALTALPPPFSLADLGVVASDEIAADAVPEPFQRVLEYTAGMLDVALPVVYRRADFGLEVNVGALTPPILLAGSHALALVDRTQLAFRLGRALTFLFPGRAAAGALPAKQLKQTLLATLTLVSPALKVEDSDGAIATLRSRLAGTSPTLARDAAPFVERILKSAQGTLSMSRYTRGLARTADRIGLVLCNDLATATRIVEHHGASGAADDLIDFSLSDEYLRARTQLGLSIAV